MVAPGLGGEGGSEGVCKCDSSDELGELALLTVDIFLAIPLWIAAADKTSLDPDAAAVAAFVDPSELEGEKFGLLCGDGSASVEGVSGLEVVAAAAKGLRREETKGNLKSDDDCLLCCAGC